MKKKTLLLSLGILLITEISPIVAVADANLINNNNLGSLIESQSPKISGNVKTIGDSISATFSDPGLADVVAYSSRINKDKILTDSEKTAILNLTSLSIPFNSPLPNKVSSLEGIELFSNLSILDLPSQNITDLTPLSSMVSLKQLTIDNNQIVDISPLSNLVNLENLWLDTNKITDISALGSLSKLTFVRLQNNEISDISILKNLPIQQAIFNNNNIKDFFGVLPSTSGNGTGQVLTQTIDLSSNVYQIDKPFINPLGNGYENFAVVKISSDNGEEGDLAAAETAIQYDYTNNSIIFTWSDKLPISGTIEIKYSSSEGYPTGGTFYLNYNKDSVIGAPITVKYQDESGNAIASDVHLEGNIGEEFTTEQKDIEGYTFKEVQGSPTGQFTDKPQVVTYVYRNNPVAAGKVTARYIDTDGNEISENVIKSGNIGEEFITEQKDIEGYTFKEVQGSPTGQFTNQVQIVTYVYTKNKNDNVKPIPKPDSNSELDDNDKLSPSNHNLPFTGENDQMTTMGIILGFIILLIGIIISIFHLKRSTQQ